MGNVWQRLLSKFNDKEVRVLMCGMFRLYDNVYKPVRFRNATFLNHKGLDAAGKTTTLYQLKLGEVVTTIPTIGEHH